MNTKKTRDTQWPRFEVFQQARDGAPHKNVGSVHAPDAEMALQNARDVFVRRPQTVNLWVAPAGAILAKTAEELATDDWRDDTVEDAPEQTYLVFNKTSQRRAMTYVTHVGEVEAASPAGALAQALAQFGAEDVYVWWIVPAGVIVRNADDDVESMFSPAHDKTYRLPHEYRTRTLMRQARKQTNQ